MPSSQKVTCDNGKTFHQGKLVAHSLFSSSASWIEFTGCPDYNCEWFTLGVKDSLTFAGVGNYVTDFRIKTLNYKKITQQITRLILYVVIIASCRQMHSSSGSQPVVRGPLVVGEATAGGSRKIKTSSSREFQITRGMWWFAKCLEVENGSAHWKMLGTAAFS